MQKTILGAVSVLCSVLLFPTQVFSYQAGWVPDEEERQIQSTGQYYQEAPQPRSYERQTYREQPRRSASSGVKHGTFSPAPSEISPPGEKVVIVDPVKHNWGAYSADGKLLQTGMATAGNRWCPDIGRSCKTKAGSFRVNSLGSAGCKSSKYPVGRGGAPMPYCMFFNGGQGLHGSYQVVPGNVSHGCVRLEVEDAKWLRFNFVQTGTKVIVKPY